MSLVKQKSIHTEWIIDLFGSQKQFLHDLIDYYIENEDLQKKIRVGDSMLSQLHHAFTNEIRVDGLTTSKCKTKEKGSQLK